MLILTFNPAWWLKNAHLQTMWSTLVGRNVQVPLQHQRLELPDGDFIDLTWDKRNALDKQKPIVLILHGLGGNIRSPYAKGLMSSLTDQGWRPVFMHLRGASDEPNRLDQTYHSGETKDLEYVVSQLQKQHPILAAVGVSLGGNMLLKWLGETGSNCPITAAVAVSVPFELDRATTYINRGFSQIYQYSLMRSLKRGLEKKYHKRSAPFNLEAAKNATCFHEYDDIVTAPLHGFSSANEYYQLSSSKHYLSHISAPLMIIHSVDDPFMPNNIIPTANDLSASTILNLTQHGGHVGFITSNETGKLEYWLEEQIPHFFQFHLT